HRDWNLGEVFADVWFLGLEEADAESLLEGRIRERPIERGHFLLGRQLVLDDLDPSLQLGELGAEAVQVGDDSPTLGNFALDGGVLRSTSTDAGLDWRK